MMRPQNPIPHLTLLKSKLAREVPQHLHSRFGKQACPISVVQTKDKCKFTNWVITHTRGLWLGLGLCLNKASFGGKNICYCLQITYLEVLVWTCITECQATVNVTVLLGNISFIHRKHIYKLFLILLYKYVCVIYSTEAISIKKKGYWISLISKTITHFHNFRMFGLVI